MKIGPFNIQIFKEKIPQEMKEELGGVGTTIFGGYISEEDYVRELTGTSALITYDKMRKSDGVVKAALLACELPIRAANWFIEPASDEEDDKEVADFIAYNLFEAMTITWDDFLRQALLMLPFGHSCFEKVFQPIEFEGKTMIGWRKFAPRLQKTILKWKTETEEDGITQMTTEKGTISIPIEKLLIFTHQKEGENWLGISVLRSAYKPWFFKNHIEKINAIAFERQGLGIPQGKLPKNYTPKDREKMEELLKNIRANEQGYMIVPEDWTVEFMDMKAGTLKEPDETIRRYNREILISVLAQFLDLGSGPTGSRALSADHSSTFHNNLTAVAKTIQDVMNKYAIKQLVDLNYTVSAYPRLKYSYIGLPRYEEISRALVGLIEKGAVTPDPKLEDYLRQIMSLPHRPEEGPEEEVTEIPKQKQLKPEKPEELELEIKKKASEFFGWRKMTFAEHKVNFPDIKRKMDKEQERLKKELDEILKRSANDLIRQLQIVLESTDNAEKRKRLKEMDIQYQGEYRKAIYNSIKEMFQYGKMMAAHEMVRDVPATHSTSISLMSQLADSLTQIMVDDLMKAGKLALLEELKKKQFSEALRHIMKSILGTAERIAFQAAMINVGSSLNQGRRATQIAYQDDVYALQRSELLDSVTCSYCLSLDGRVFRKNDSFTRNDIFHSSCRGIWVEILKTEEEKPDIEGIPQSLRDAYESINVFEPPKHPIIKKESLAAEYLKSVGKI